MKIRYVDFYKVVIYVLVFLNLGFLNFLKNYTMKIQLITVIVVGILLTVYFIQPQKTKIPDIWIILYMFMLFILLAIEIIRLNNDMYARISVLNAINSTRNYTFVFLFFPIYEILSSDKKTREKFIRVIVFLGFSALFVRFCGWFIYNYLGYNLIPGYFEVMGYNWIRNGNVRIGGTFLDGFVFVYLCLQLLKKVHVKVILSFVFMFVYAYLVYGSRSQILCYVCTFIILYMVKDKNLTKGVINSALVLGLVVVIIYTNSDVQNFLSSFSVNDEVYGLGTRVRVDGQKLYHQQWLESSLLYGFGITDDGNYIGLTKYYLSDLGILRNLYQYGAIGFLICVIPFIDGLRVAVLGVLRKNGTSVFLLGLVMYTIMSSIASQNVYDYSRIMILPFLLAFTGISFHRRELQGEYANG